MANKFLAGKVATKIEKDFIIKEEMGGLRLRGLVHVKVGDIVAVVAREIERGIYKVEQQEIINTKRLMEILKHRRKIKLINTKTRGIGQLNSCAIPDNDFQFTFNMKRNTTQDALMEVHAPIAITRIGPKTVLEALSEKPKSIAELKSIFPHDDVEKLVMDLQYEGIAFELDGKICLL